MPVIPTYRRDDINLGRLQGGPVSIPGIPPGIHAEAESFSSGAGQAAGELSKVADIATELAEKWHKASQITELNNTQLDTLKQVTDFEKGLAGRNDYKNFEAEWDNLIGGIQKGYEEKNLDDNVFQALTNDLVKMHLEGGVKIGGIVRKKTADFGRASYFNAKDSYEKLFSGEDEGGREDIIQRFKVATAENFSAGYITAQEAGENLIKFSETTERTRAGQDLRRNPEKFNPDDYPSLTPGDKITLSDHALRLHQANLKQQIKQQEDAEKEIEKIRTQLIENSDYQAYQGFFNKTMTFEMLEEIASAREISEGAYINIRDRMEKPEKTPQENNPIVLGEIQEEIERGRDARPLLKAALQRGDIKDGTYITMIGQVVKKEYEDAVSFVARALEPSEADRWSQDKHLKYAEAMDRFNTLIDSGMEPGNASKTVVNSYTSDLRRSIHGLRRPMFLKGQKNNLADLITAEEASAQAYLKKEISETAYLDELQLIDQLKNIVSAWENINEQGKEEYEKLKVD